MFVVLVGNPIDGMTIHGPFEDGNEAGDWAQSEFQDDTWWIVEVKKP